MCYFVVCICIVQASYLMAWFDEKLQVKELRDKRLSILILSILVVHSYCCIDTVWSILGCACREVSAGSLAPRRHSGNNTLFVTTYPHT